MLHKIKFIHPTTSCGGYKLVSNIFVRLDLLEILTFLLIFHSYNFDLKILYIDGL
jgi:hypothetical protein